ncbi:uncharacterized protein METZ01_LOCUS356220 [marine metagenome]|uniref:Uncharacterized protein n=1 Tax=marine metagenome TaxID=408172 RepID=A0A382S0D3_9ZZZZ
MKKIASILFLLSGTLFIVISITSEDTDIWLPLGCAFITIGIVFRKKGGAGNDSEKGELLTDEEEKQVWEEFKSKEDKDDN